MNRPTLTMKRRDLLATLAGAIAARSLGANAQSPRPIPTVGVLWHAANISEETPFFQTLIEGFTDLGYMEGQNIKIEHRLADEKPNLFTSMAAELVSLSPDI